MMNYNLHKEEQLLQQQLGDWLSKEKKEQRQKSRESWLKLGNMNTKFFYVACKVRNYKNQISQLVNDASIRTSDEKEIRKLAPKFYKGLIIDDSYWKSFPRLVVKKKLTQAASQWLIRSVSEAEIKKAAFQFNPEQMVSMLTSFKSTGPLWVSILP